MQYDTTLKELFQQAPQRLLQLLINDTALELLTVEFPTVRQRRPDLVARLAGGGIFHLELQSGNEADMDWRMLEYYLFLFRLFGQPPLQHLLYVGEAPLRMDLNIRHSNLQYRCPVTDLRDIDGRLLLDSPQLEDRLLAVLCRLEDPHRALRAIVTSIQQLPPKARADALKRLLILSGLRNLETVLKQEIRSMALTIDISKNLFFKEAFQKGLDAGRAKGEAEVLLRLLKLRFGDLTDHQVRRIRSADADTLLRWSERILSAASLDEVLAD